MYKRIRIMDGQTRCKVCGKLCAGPRKNCCSKKCKLKRMKMIRDNWRRVHGY